MKGPGEGEMEAGKSVYQVTAQFICMLRTQTQKSYYYTPGSWSVHKANAIQIQMVPEQFVF